MTTHKPCFETTLNCTQKGQFEVACHGLPPPLTKHSSPWTAVHLLILYLESHHGCHERYTVRIEHIRTGVVYCLLKRTHRNLRFQDFNRVHFGKRAPSTSLTPHIPTRRKRPDILGDRQPYCHLLVRLSMKDLGNQRHCQCVCRMSPRTPAADGTAAKDVLWLYCHRDPCGRSSPWRLTIAVNFLKLLRVWSKCTGDSRHIVRVGRYDGDGGSAGVDSRIGKSIKRMAETPWGKRAKQLHSEQQQLVSPPCPSPSQPRRLSGQITRISLLPPASEHLSFFLFLFLSLCGLDFFYSASQSWSPVSLCS
ncbi:hypothetical protein C8Q73DRAFT_63661 [Cubamyces lactineus]|nr:hypothetical protein C8Q73DRAFT_63661 [Cubamyces lactineus]